MSKLTLYDQMSLPVVYALSYQDLPNATADTAASEPKLQIDKDRIKLEKKIKSLSNEKLKNRVIVERTNWLARFFFGKYKIIDESEVYERYNSRDIIEVHINSLRSFFIEKKLSPLVARRFQVLSESEHCHLSFDDSTYYVKTSFDTYFDHDRAERDAWDEYLVELSKFKKTPFARSFVKTVKKAVTLSEKDEREIFYALFKSMSNPLLSKSSLIEQIPTVMNATGRTTQWAESLKTALSDFITKCKESKFNAAKNQAETALQKKTKHRTLEEATKAAGTDFNEKKRKFSASFPSKTTEGLQNNPSKTKIYQITKQAFGRNNQQGAG